MNRRLSMGGDHPFASCHGKLFCHHPVRKVIGIVIVAVGWTFFLVDWLDSPAPSTSSSPQLVQQMIWNPSPK